MAPKIVEIFALFSPKMVFSFLLTLFISPSHVYCLMSKFILQPAVMYKVSGVCVDLLDDEINKEITRR